MPQKKKVDHIHQYKRVKWGKEGQVVYRCMKNCGHFLYPEFLIGRVGECPICKKAFTLTYTDAHRRLPHCSDCSTRKVAQEVEIPRLRTGSNLQDELIGYLEANKLGG